MKKYIFIIIVSLFSFNVQAQEPNFNIVGSNKNLQFPTFVGGVKAPTSIIPPKPQGEGWQWDEQRKVWWKYGFFNSPYNYYCPQGVCPK